MQEQQLEWEQKKLDAIAKSVTNFINGLNENLGSSYGINSIISIIEGLIKDDVYLYLVDEKFLMQKYSLNKYRAKRVYDRLYLPSNLSKYEVVAVVAYSQQTGKYYRFIIETTYDYVLFNVKVERLGHEEVY